MIFLTIIGEENDLRTNWIYSRDVSFEIIKNISTKLGAEVRRENNGDYSFKGIYTSLELEKLI